MHLRLIILHFALAAALVPSVAAQTPPLGSPPEMTQTRVGEIDFGARATAVDGDAARFQRLRDLRDGPTLDRVRYDREMEAWNFRAAMDHVGYRDQRYQAAYERYGRIKASFTWDQVPLFYSADTRTPFRQVSEGMFRLDEALRAAIERGAGTTALFVPESRQFNLRSRRDVADARFVYAVAPHADVRMTFTSTGRNGAQPWGTSFGQTNAVELPVPVDHRTNDLNATVEWATDRGMARLAYDGSWFNNGVETLIWDNPLRATDLATAPAQGRMALWPDSTAHTASAAGSVALPARTRGFAYVSVGTWLQDEELLPHTINSAIPVIPLPRATAEAEARIIAMNYRVTSRPAPAVWLNGQFRLYDYDNRTPHFPVGQYVRTDSGSATSLTGGSEPFGYIRHFVDLDASFTPIRFTAFRVGYGREHDDRTFRFLEETTDQTLRAAIDSVGLTWGSVRLQYERAQRTGEGLDEEVFSDIGEQVSLRQFDISDRVRHRVTAVLQVMPLAAVGLNGSIGIGRESRPDAAFGLQDNDLRSVTVGVDLAPREDVLLGATYSLENYSTLQRSRQANPGPQFDDPTRDWSTDLDEDVHTVTASLDLPAVAERTTVRLSYDYVRSHAQYLYLVPPNSTLPPPQQLAPVRNEIQRAVADLQYAWSRRVAVGIGYAYDRFDVDDFAQSPGTLNSPVFPTIVNLMYQWRPYAAHTGAVRVMYRW
jgi:MtrB/PioB family decaheme-associated outer membrane protein